MKAAGTPLGEKHEIDVLEMSETEVQAPPELEPVPEAVLVFDPAPWGIRGAIAVTLLSFAVQIVVALILSAIASAAIGFMDPGLLNDADEFRDLVVLVTVVPIAFLYTIFTLVIIHTSITRVWRRPFAESLKIRTPGLSGLAASLALGAVMAGGFVVLASLSPPEQDIGGPLARLAETGLVGHLVWILLAVVMAPTVEEILFRGYAYLGIRQKLGPVAAGITVSAVFLLLHIGETGLYLPALAGIGGMAIVLIVLMERGGNLTYCIACHLGYNATLSILSFIAGE